MPTASPDRLGARLLVAVGLAVAAWTALGAAVPATFGAHVSVDEPQYLLSATSLGEDLDLDIADELAGERWRTYHRAELPEQTKVLEDGRRLSPHDPLLPALLAGPVRLAGWVGAKLALAAVAGALAASLVWVGVRRLAVPVAAAVVTVLCFSLAPPLAVYGTQVYPEVPAALAVTAAIGALAGAPTRRALAVLLVAVAALPWLSVKYAPVAVALGALAVVLTWRRAGRRQASLLALALALAAAVCALGHLALYGALTPYAVGDHFVGGELTVMGSSPDHLGRSRRLLGLLVDRHFGLVPWQPAWLLALPALGALVRRRPAWWPTLVAPLVAGWLTATFVALTMHGFWWPGRQVVVVLPALVLVVAWWAGTVAPAARRVVAAGLAVGAVTWAWLVVDGAAGRLTWVVDFTETSNPLPRLWRPLLPDLRELSGGDEVRFVAWCLLAALLVGFGWRRARRSLPPRLPPPPVVSSPSPVPTPQPSPTRKDQPVHRALSRPLALLAGVSLVLAACGDDDGAGVRQIGGSDCPSASGSASASAPSGSAAASAPATGSGSATGSASASGSASHACPEGSGSGSHPASGSPATGSEAGAAGEPLGGYTPLSDVSSHAAVALDVCQVNELLDTEPIDFEAVSAVYAEGGHSMSGDSARTLRGFATEARDEPVWNTYAAHYDDPTWLDTWVTAALEGTGPFEGASDAVRRQGVQKGIQNQVMVAWTIHELESALAKAEAGELDVDSGAPHSWDEAWAFYHGAETACAPFTTAEKRGADFGTGSAVNDAVLEAMNEGQAAVESGDVDAARAAADEVVRQVTITYVQAAIKYAAEVDAALAAGDAEEAAVQQAEGASFFRVVEPLVAEADPDAAAAVAQRFDLSAGPQEGSGDAVRTALESAYAGLGITADEVGTFAG